MLRTILITPDRELGQHLHRVLTETSEVSIVRLVDHYPETINLTWMLRSSGPQVVFLSVDSPGDAAEIIAHIDQVMPGIQVVAFARSCDPQVLVEIMRAGIREFLASPFERGCVFNCLKRLRENLARRPVVTNSSELLYSFLPAKPGVGATTLAVNSSLAVARAEGDPGALLMDFDLNCGMVRFMLNLDSTYSVVDAAERAGAMDENLWPQIATKCEKLDVVHSGSMGPDLRIQNLQIQHLLEFSRRNYKVVSADLSGNFEKYSMEIMRESRQIFLVCTPEVAALHLAREKLQYLHRMDLGHKVRLLVNRFIKRSSMQPEDIEQVVGAPVMMTFPNDYTRVARALTSGKPVEATSGFGRACGQLAATMLKRQNTPEVQPRRRFVDYFHISPAKFTLERGKT